MDNMDKCNHNMHTLETKSTSYFSEGQIAKEELILNSSSL